MADFAIQDARALFTKTLVAVYQERLAPTPFLKSFFPVETVPTKSISIEVERMGEKVAVDVIRGTEGNRNEFTRSTEKIFVPPLYREYFDATELDLYDRVLGSQGNAQAPLFAALANSVSDRLMLLKDKIERAVELQRVQVLTTGVITTRTLDQIDFKRKAASIVNLTATKFSSAGTDPFDIFANAGKFLRTVGKSGDTIFNVILAEDTLAALLTNPKFTARQNYFNMALDQVQPVVRNSVGAAYHGTITGGAYKFNLWTYPQFYDLRGGTDSAPTFTSTPYIPNGYMIVIPAQPKFKTVCAAVPQLIGQPGQLPVQGEYVTGEFLDTRKAKHDFDIQSAPIAIPVAVDQIYTAFNLV